MDINASKNKNEERLQKIMASCGVASRRKCEELIAEGHVTVNGVVVRELGTKARYSDDIRVDGNQIAKEEKVYYAMYKPTGYLTTVSDDLGRRTVMDLFTEADLVNRIFPVGRLDYDSSGVLLFTNDGELSRKLTDAKNQIEKEYVVRLDGYFTQENLVKLRRGVMLDGRLAKPYKAQITEWDKEHNSTQVQLILTEGRNREIRRMFESLGFPVKKLKRTRFANITLGDLKKGDYRPLSIKEVKVLYSL